MLQGKGGALLDRCYWQLVIDRTLGPNDSAANRKVQGPCLPRSDLEPYSLLCGRVSELLEPGSDFVFRGGVKAKWNLIIALQSYMSDMALRNKTIN
jgi:hypothetical protein